jgi:hypothetical protein
MQQMEFKETQGFRVWWAWGGILALNGLFIYALVSQVVLGTPFGPKPASDAVLICCEAASLLFLLFIFSIKLTTTVSSRGISYQLFPFQQKPILLEWRDLHSAYMRPYNSFYEYGGWGLRTGSGQTGNAVNTSASSNIGLQLQLKNGKLLLIGTRKPEALREAVNHYLPVP